MTRHLLWALIVAILLALLAFALLPTPATGTPPTGTGDQPSSFRFVPLRGVDARGRPSPPAALSEPALPAPPTPLSASPSASSAPAATPVRIPAPTERAASRAGSIRGVGTWYRYVPGGAAAGPALRAALGPGWRGMTVAVCVTDGGAMACVRVRLTDWCACRDRPGGPTLVDLDAGAFAALMPLSRGIVTVEVDW